ncbi:hypothetical protein [Flavobacterium cupreum]|uniref:hypothetical protein n=1 Tax=Flavobacterium cupreum TaxID=2133766 RepID=UPI000FCCD0C7|nr:hypothetical protein [Flavobacterium cupreum]
MKNTNQSYKTQIRTWWKENAMQNIFFLLPASGVWCICIFFILMWKGLGKLNLSDEIIITLIGSTTLNILVFFTLVTKYLFNSEKST